MRHFIAAAAALATVSFAAAPAQSAQQATIVIDNILQTLTIQNAGGSTAQVVEIVYDFGGAAVGIATFEAAPGATASNFWVALPPSDPDFLELWQTSTWSGLTVAPGAQQVFAGIDPEIITSLLPPDFDTNPDAVGTSLVNATVTVRWSDGAVGTAELIEQSWERVQTLALRGAVAVPAPAAAGLLALGLLGLGVASRRRG